MHLINGLENRIPPPVVVIFSGFTGWLIDEFFESKIPGARHFEIVSVVFLVVGFLFGLLGIISFKLANTTINPLKPEATSALVKSGIYKISRNPMYVGLAFLLTAWCLYLGSLLSLVSVILFVSYIYRFQIIPEERAMESLFGDDFIDYKSKVRRWI